MEGCDMDFSDIRTIIIGEAGEYGKRLVRYLEMQFRTDSYQKLSLILIQSFTKGGREAAMLMEAEEREAFHKRIDRAKKEGEEASTRLLFPMILLLCQVMLLVMYPALTRFQGF